MISLKEYKKLRELLHASDEDYQIACENIKNMDLTSVEKMMFAKSLMFGRRQDFCEKFKLDSHAIKEWNEMFKDLDNTLGIRTEQEIIEWELHQQMLPVFQDTWKFIKDIKITLNWDHEKPIEPLSEEDMGELEKMINNDGHTG
jgi:hypothetical protein